MPSLSLTLKRSRYTFYIITPPPACSSGQLSTAPYPENLLVLLSDVQCTYFFEVLLSFAYPHILASISHIHLELLGFAYRIS